MSNNTGNTLIALLVGATIGAAAGILLAPDKGSNTRKKIKKGFDDAKDNLKHKLDDVGHEIRNKFAHLDGNLDDNYDHLITNINHKKEDAISFLENKLADLKKQKLDFKK